MTNEQEQAIDQMAELIADDLIKQCSLLIKGRLQKWAKETRKQLKDKPPGRPQTPPRPPTMPCGVQQ